MRRFELYRREDISATHPDGTYNRPDEVQVEGVVFTDGTCVVRWRTAFPSTVFWNSMDHFLSVHGHFQDDYGTELVWIDE